LKGPSLCATVKLTPLTAFHFPPVEPGILLNLTTWIARPLYYVVFLRVHLLVRQTAPPPNRRADYYRHPLSTPVPVFFLMLRRLSGKQESIFAREQFLPSFFAQTSFFPIPLMPVRPLFITHADNWAMSVLLGPGSEWRFHLCDPPFLPVGPRGSTLRLTARQPSTSA